MGEGGERLADLDRLVVCNVIKLTGKLICQVVLPATAWIVLD